MKNKELSQTGVIIVCLVVVFMFIIGLGKVNAKQRVFVKYTSEEVSDITAKKVYINAIK